MRDQSRKIERFIELERRELASRSCDPKILILGSGDSGKTTFLKQMQIIYKNGYSISEKEQFRIPIIRFIIKSITCLARNVSVDEADLRILYKINGNLEANSIETIIKLWNNSNIQAYYRLNDSAVHRSIEWFLPKIKCFASKSYLITNQGFISFNI
jgi:energy-coupling factor transporter ATP-binding protein EcfA2